MTADADYLQALNDSRPVDPPPPLISEWVHGRRVMPANTPFPGLWDNYRSPYGIEIADNMSPYSPVQTTSVMKGAQLGLTAWAENVIGYWMDANPTEVAYASATDDLLEKWVTKRLDPLIDSIGMRHKIFAQIDPSRAKSRRTGDTTIRKEFPGGTLDMMSAQSASSLRSDSKRVLVVDEIDGAPRMLRTGEGVWLDVLYARTNAWGPRKKILEFSTPGTFEESLIWERYEAGDQRKYMVPCPNCATLDVLEFKHLRHEMRDGQLHSVWYQCPHCDKPIHNHQKTWMMDPRNGAYWQPTAKARRRGHRSYHISSLYSPVGMLSWYELFEKYLEAQQTPSGMRSFVTLYLGKPYKEKGSRPKVEKVLELRGDYLDGKAVPPGVLFLTMGVDVQQGSGWNAEANCPRDPANPPRLELEILGNGAGHRTWSLLYKVIEGPIDDAHAGAWEAMHQWALSGGLSIRRADGVQFPVALAFIDSGDGNYVDVVYTFTSRWRDTYPSKGFNALKKRKEEKGDEVGPASFKRYRAARNERSGDVTFYEISTVFYKSHTYTNLKIPRRDIGGQAPGFCEFPRDRSEKYFIGLTAEEKRVDGSFHAGGRRNEPLDCRVMALCAADVFLDARVTAARAAAKARGASDIELQGIDHVLVLEHLRRQVEARAAA